MHGVSKLLFALLMDLWYSVWASVGERACDVRSSFKRTSTPFRTRPQVFFGDVRWDSKSKTVVLEGLCAEPDKYTTEVLQAPLEVLANYFGVRVVFTLGTCGSVLATQDMIAGRRICRTVKLLSWLGYPHSKRSCGTRVIARDEVLSSNQMGH